MLIPAGALDGAAKTDNALRKSDKRRLSAEDSALDAKERILALLPEWETASHERRAKIAAEVTLAEFTFHYAMEDDITGGRGYLSVEQRTLTREILAYGRSLSSRSKRP